MIRTRVKIPLQNCAEAEFITFNFEDHAREDIAIAFPGWEDQKNPLVRIHSECLTGDVFQSKKCDCNAQLNESIDLFSKAGGILIYLRQEGRAIGLYNKLDAYAVQNDTGLDTFQANLRLGFPEDARDYKIAAMMLKDLGLNDIKLISNNPLKSQALEKYGVTIHETIATGLFSNPHNIHYLETKRKSGHKI